MDTTLFDLYGTIDNAVAALKNALSDEPAWERLDVFDKVVFQDWIEDNAKAYKDGDRIDWVGAFYDWYED